MDLIRSIKSFFLNADLAQESVEEKTDKAYYNLIEGSGSIGDLIEEDKGWRRLGALSEKLELNPAEQNVMVKLVMWFTSNSPLAVKIIRTMSSHIIGSHYTFACDDEELQAALQDFWNDPSNNLDSDAVKMCREWLSYGELFLPVFAGQQSGRLHFGYLHPSQVEEVKTHPENGRIFTEVKERMTDGKYRTWTILNSPEVLGLLRNGDLPPSEVDERTGEVIANNWILYFPLQQGMWGRGRSIMESMFYWVHRAEQYLNDRMMLNNLLKAFIWDVTVQGNDETVKRIKNEIEGSPPVPGSVRVHNETVTWLPIAPEINSKDSIEDYTAVLKHIAQGASFPDHWIGAEADVNRSTADSSSEPTIKDLEVLQSQYFEGVLKVILQIQSYFYYIAGSVPKVEGAIDSIHFEVPDLTATDNLRVADATLKISQAIRGLLADRLIDMQTARQLIYNTAGVEQPEALDELIQQDVKADVLGIYRQVQQ